MGQDDTGIGEQPAPIAGMMTALAQVDDQIEIQRPAAAERQRRAVGPGARTVRADEDVRGEIPVLDRKSVV